MKLKFAVPALLGCASPLALLPVSAATAVVLNSAASSDASSLSTVPFGNAAQAAQYQIAAAQLSSLVGESITSIGFRINGAATPGDLDARTFTDYEITLSPANNAFGSISSTAANNLTAAAMKVYDGALSIGASAFPYGQAVNAFYTIAFNQGGYMYTGGDLVVMIRHTGGVEGAYQLDAASTSDPQAGNVTGRQVFGRSANSFGAATLGFTSPVPVMEFTSVPEPAQSAAIAGVGLLAFAACRRTRRRQAGAVV